MKIIVEMKEGKTFASENAHQVEIASPGILSIYNVDGKVVFMSPLTSVLGVHYPENDSPITLVR